MYTKSVFNDSYNVHDDLKGIDTIKLNTEQSQSLEGLLTLKEILITLKNMKHDKSPGSDGFTAEFFKVFWKDLGHFIVRSLNYGFTSGTMSVT